MNMNIVSHSYGFSIGREQAALLVCLICYLVMLQVIKNRIGLLLLATYRSTDAFGGYDVHFLAPIEI